MGRPAGVTLGAVGGVGRGDGGHAGAPDEAEGCEAARGEAAGAEAGWTQTRLARLGEHRAGGCSLGLSCCCCLRKRSRSVVGEDLIC